MATKENKDNSWMQQLWRPMMGWMYMVICMLDMAIFPVLWSALQAIMHQPITQWDPLTLRGAGLFHIAMGAVLGISAFGRTQEKLAGTAANPTATTNTTVTQTTGGNNGGFNSGATGFGAPQTGGFGGSQGGFGSSPASTGFGAGSFGGAPSTSPQGFGGGFGGSSAPQPVAFTASGKKIVPDFDQPLQ